MTPPFPSEILKSPSRMVKHETGNIIGYEHCFVYSSPFRLSRNEPVVCLNRETVQKEGGILLIYCSNHANITPITGPHNQCLGLCLINLPNARLLSY